MIHIEAVAAFGKKKERHMREGEARAPGRRRKDAAGGSPVRFPVASSSSLSSASAASLAVRPSAYKRICARRGHSMRHENEDRAAQVSPLGLSIVSATEQKSPLLLALFCDGFVCRHYTTENECVEGFAQPYDAESGYFLECIQGGQIPDGLADMVLYEIACKSRNKQIQAQIHDFRATPVACPASSVDLPSVLDSALQCRSWDVILRPTSPDRMAKKMQPSQPLISPFPSEVSDKQWDILGENGDKQLLEIVFPATNDVVETASKADSPRQPLSLPHLSRPRNSQHRLQAATTTSLLADSLSQAPVNGHASPLAHPAGFGKVSGQNDSKNYEVTSHRRNAELGRSGTVNTKKENRSGNAMKAPAATPRAVSALKWNKLVPPSTPRRRTKGSPRQSDLILRRQGKHDRRQHSGHHSGRGRSSSDNSYASMPPLPATQLFLSKLKRKRLRVVSTELHYGKPAWVTINHIGLFFHAATQFERHYAHSLHTNVDRLMKSESSSDADADKPDVGSMSHLAQSLQPMAWPTQIIADVSRKRRSVEGEHLNQSAVVSAQYNSIVGTAQEYPIVRTTSSSLPRQPIAPLPTLVGPPSDHEDVEQLYLL